MSKTVMTMLVCVVGMVLGASVTGWGAPLGTTTTYQGRLMDGDSPADGEYDFQFKLYDEPQAGIQVGSTISKYDEVLVGGLFTVELDFDSSPFHGDARWLEIWVDDGSTGLTKLVPRQEMTPTPYALYAANAGSDSDWMVSGNNMYSIPSGDVGIGIASPLADLHIHGAASLRLTNANTGTAWNSGIQLSHWTADSINAILWNRNNGFFSLGTNNTEKMRITADGKVGIGTTTPQNKLDVEGTLAVGASYSGTDTAPSNGMIIEGDVGIGTNDPWSKLHVKGEILVDTPSSGNGVHVENAWGHGFHVYDAGTHGFNVYQADDNGLNVGDVGGHGVYVFEADLCGIDAIGFQGNHLRSHNSGYYGLRVHSLGDSAEALGLYVDGVTHVTGESHFMSDVGIGTSNPQGLLDVHSGASETSALFVRSSPSVVHQGGLLHHQTGTYAWQQATDNTSNSSFGGLVFHYVNRTAPNTKVTSDVLVLRANGRVGIGVNDPVRELDVNGTARLRSMSTGTGTTVHALTDGTLVKLTSSKKYKKNIDDLEIDPDAVLQLRPVSFQYKSSGQEDIGLIAEEVETHLKDLVIYDAEGKADAVKYDRVALYLLEVVKAQQQRITDLETLKAENQLLKQRLEVLERTVRQQPLDLSREVK
jgi:endosialidase-like protein